MRMCVCVHARMYVCTYACMYVCIHVCLYACMYVYSCMNKECDCVHMRAALLKEYCDRDVGIYSQYLFFCHISYDRLKASSVIIVSDSKGEEMKCVRMVD